MPFPYGKIVAVSPARLGDTIMLTPAIRFLKSARAEVSLDVVCLTDLAAQVLSNNPDIDRLFYGPDDPALKRQAGCYDLGLNLHTSRQALSCYEELGVPSKGPLPVDPERHAARQALDLVAELVGERIPSPPPPYALYPQEEHFRRVEALLASRGAVPGREVLVGCHLGCHGIAKRGKRFWKPLVHEKAWPVERFVALVQKALEQDSRVRFVLTGSQNEKRLARPFKPHGEKVVNLIGCTSVLDLAALMRRLDVYITPDTGSLHVACAMGGNLIALFGPTPLSRTGPWPQRPNHRVIRKRALDQISVEEVLEALLELTHDLSAQREEKGKERI